MCSELRGLSDTRVGVFARRYRWIVVRSLKHNLREATTQRVERATGPKGLGPRFSLQDRPPVFFVRTRNELFVPFCFRGGFAVKWVVKLFSRFFTPGGSGRYVFVSVRRVFLCRGGDGDQATPVFATLDGGAKNGGVVSVGRLTNRCRRRCSLLYTGVRNLQPLLYICGNRSLCLLHEGVGACCSVTDRYGVVTIVLTSCCGRSRGRTKLG